MLSIDISGIVTISSAGTLVLGFAAKDMLANFFGGFMIFTDKPFKVGDWIRTSEKKIEGIVEHIGWRVTRIRTFEKHPLYVQNSIFLNISIENPSRMTNRCIRITFSLPYCDINKLKKINLEIEKMLYEHEDIDNTKTIFVSLTNFSKSALDCLVCCFTKTTHLVEYQHLQQNILLKINKIIQTNGSKLVISS